MKRTYITVISLQATPSDLKCNKYIPHGFNLKDNFVTSFPILPVIINTVEPDDEVELLVIRLHGKGTDPNTKDMVISKNYKGEAVKYDRFGNYKTFKNQLETMKKEFKFEENNITVKEVDLPFKENPTEETLLEIFKAIIDKIEDDTTVYSCITYGTKCIPAVLLNAIPCAINLRKNVRLGGIYYGEIIWGKNENHIYDASVLLRLRTIVENLSHLKSEHTQEVLDQFLWQYSQENNENEE